MDFWGRFLTFGIMFCLNALSSAESMNPDPNLIYVPRILSINRRGAITHGDTMAVKPGDVIFLSIDLLGLGGECGVGCRQNQSVEDFVWGTSFGQSDECDPKIPGSCLDHSRFEANDYGVSFYVPYDLGQSVTVSGRHKTYSTWDSITLVNRFYVADESPPPNKIFTDLNQYSLRSFDPRYALQGQGNWIDVEGGEYFVPYLYQEDWEPYQNGYWTWIVGSGWNWISYDPWGWFTDHYGVWRHHRTFGWIWTAYDSPAYHPSAVTWFFGNGYIGWYPYDREAESKYKQGWDAGFDDGFELGYEAGALYGAGSKYHSGHTVVAFGNFNDSNIRNIKVGREESVPYWNYSYATRWFGRLPGNQDLENSRRWMEGQIGNTVFTTRLKEKTFGERVVFAPRSLYQWPAKYLSVVESLSPKLRPPLGALVMPPQTAGEKPIVIAPTQNERGIEFPPMTTEAEGSPIALAPNTERLAIPNPTNPIFHRETIPAQPHAAPSVHPYPDHPLSLPHPNPVPPPPPHPHH
jgi:hypothetical protein